MIKPQKGSEQSVAEKQNADPHHENRRSHTQGSLHENGGDKSGTGERAHLGRVRSTGPATTRG